MSNILAEMAISKVQSRVGKFLTLKDILLPLKQHPSLSVQSDAAALLATQSRLETDLGTANTKITNIQKGAWTYSDLGFLTTIAYQIEKQINDVDNLSKEANNQASTGLTEGSLIDKAIANWKYILGGYMLLRMIRK